MAKTKTPQAAAQRGSGPFSNLSARERKLLLAMVATLGTLAIIVVVGLTQRSLAEIEDETLEYQATLDLLAVAGPALARKQAQSQGESRHVARFTDEVLVANDVKLTSFVATHAAATNITVSSYDEDQIPLGSKSKAEQGPVIIERQLRVDIRSANMNDLVELLDRIEKAREPVVIKRVDIRGTRAKDGVIRAMLVVSTFVKREKES